MYGFVLYVLAGETVPWIHTYRGFYIVLVLKNKKNWYRDRTTDSNNKITL